MTSKTKRDPKIEEFFNSLLVKQNLNIVEKVGLQDTSMNVVPLGENEIGVKEIFVFTNEGNQLLNTKFARILDFNGDEIYSNIRNLIIPLQKICNIDNNFNIQKIYINGLKIIFLIKSQIVVCGIFSESGSTLLAKLYLYFIFSSMSNYCNQTIITMNRFKLEALTNIFALRDKNQTVNEKSGKIIVNNSFELYPVKFFQEYFAKPFTLYFNRISKFISKKEDWELENIKFKNMYIIDPITKEILFDLSSIRKKIKNKKFYKNERVWSEIIYHANNLLNSYKNNVGMEFDAKQKANRFVKFESTSTFPRLTYIIKFLPVLKGLAVIHIYSQNKLSRGDFNESLKSNKQYKEVDILYGTETKENSNLEFKYSEPPKLTELEEIFTELFIANYKNSEYFYRRSNKLVYFDDVLINKINELVLDNTNTISSDNVYSRVNNYFYEIYSKNRQSLSNDTSSKQSKKEEKRELIMYITKEDIMKEFFKGIEKKINLSKLDGTLNLSKIDDGIGNEMNDISLDFNPKISFNDNKEDENLPSFIYVNNNNTSFSGILMKDWESKRQHQYEPIENSIGNNKLEIVNNNNFNVFDPNMNMKSNGNESNNK